MNMSTNLTPELATLEQAQEMGLRADEFDKIKEILERTPNFTELSIFGVMWSEHCSYKNSIVWLKKLPKDGPHMLVEAGEENAGLVDIGDGLACYSCIFLILWVLLWPMRDLMWCSKPSDGASDGRGMGEPK